MNNKNKCNVTKGCSKYEDMLNGIERFISENNKFPRVKEIESCKYLPSYSTVCKLCKTNGTTIDEVATGYGFDRGRNTLYSYDEYIAKYIQVASSTGERIKIKDLSKYNLPSSRWFVEYCPNKNITTYDAFVEWLGFKSSCTSKEKAIEMIYAMQSKLARPLFYDDFRNPTQENVSIGVVNRFWGSLNNMKSELGLEINQDDMMGRSKSKEELLDDLKAYIETMGKIPSTSDFGKDNLLSSCTYNKYFGGINNAIELLGYAPTKKSTALYLSNEEICEMYKEIFDDNGCALTFEYCSHNQNLPSPSTILRRFKCTWNEFLQMLGYDIIQTPLGQSCKANDGTICLSKTECVIHNILLDIGFDCIDKEVLYRDFCNGYNGLKRCDWVIILNNVKYIVEYFGLMQRDSYAKSHDEKLKLIMDNGLMDRFIPLYPSDLKNIREKIINKIK